MVRALALASHQCGPGSNPGVGAICGLNLLLVNPLARRGFSPGTPVFPSPQKPTLPNSKSIWNARTGFNEFLRTPKCSVGKQITKLQNYLVVVVVVVLAVLVVDGIVVVKSGIFCYRDDSCLYKFSTFSLFPEFRVVVPWCNSNVLCNNHHPLRASS